MANIKGECIANELEMIKRIINGEDIPEYFNVKEFNIKLFRYYYYDMQYSIEDSCKEICNFLDNRNILYSKKEVYSIPTWYKLDKGKGLRASTKPLRFYKSEIDLIKGINCQYTRQTQRLAFGFLLVSKFQQQYTNMNEPTAIYKSIRDICLLVNISACSKRTDKFIIELGRLGYISAPLNKNCIYCNMVSDGSDEVMLEIYNFEPNMVDGLFDTLFGKNEIIVLAIPQCEEDEWFIDTLVNMKKRLGFSSGDSSITKCCNFNGRIKTKDFMFFKVEEDDTEEFLNWIVKCYQQYLLVNYRKIKKDNTLDKVRVFFNSNICRQYFQNKQEI